MSLKTQKILSALILGIFGFYNLFAGAIFILTIQSLTGIYLVVSGIAAFIGIVGIKKKNKTFLWVGVVLSAIQIIKAFYSLVTIFIFSVGASLGGCLFTILIYILPLSLMYKMIKGKERKLNWSSFRS